MNVIETVMTEKEWKKHNKEWLEGYVIAATSQKFKRWKRRLNFQKFSGLVLLLIALFIVDILSVILDSYLAIILRFRCIFCVFQQKYPIFTW